MIRDEIANSMDGFSATPEGATATFTFGESFAGFDGHFPSGAVLPGICQVICALETLGRWRSGRASLIELQNAKYLLPVLPSQSITVSCSGLKELGEGMVGFKATITRGKERVSELKLKAAIVPMASGGKP